jgi:hypothetical protein
MHVGKKNRGTVWVVTHEERSKQTRPISAEYQVHEIMELVQHLTKAA